MPHPFHSALILIERAKERTEDLCDELILLSTTPEKFGRRIVEHRDHPLPYEHHGFEFSNEIPDDIAIATRDVIHNLRQALDHIGFACAMRPDARKTHYPFSKKKKEIQNTANRNCKDIPKPIIDEMLRFRPYADEDGDKLLYALNELRNFNEHRLLQPMAQVTHVTNLKWQSNIQTTPEMLENPEKWANPLLEPEIFYPPIEFQNPRRVFFSKIDPRFTEPPEIEIAVGVAFGDVAGLKGEFPVAVFRQMIPMVEEIVAAISRKAAEIDLFERWRLRRDIAPYENEFLNRIKVNRARADEDQSKT